MKKGVFFAAIIVFTGFSAHSQFIKKLGDKVKAKTNQRIDQKTDQAIDRSLEHIQDSIENAGKSTGSSTGNTSATTGANNPAGNTSTPVTTTTQHASFKSYANYDFIPGDSVLFEDNFVNDEDGEFASHWNLDAGQGVVNKMDNKTVLLITDGGWVSPLMKKKSYLGNEWTLELDNIKKEETYQLKVYLQDAEKNDLGTVFVNSDGITVNFKDADGGDKSLFGSYVAGLAEGKFHDKWHHIAIAYKNKQLKVYVDQFRMIVVPNMGITPAAIAIGGIASQSAPLVFTNLRIAAGGKMNMLTKKFTDTKIVTHGINFDVNKSVIKPESMGTLNAVVQIMKDNPEMKFEVGGHTDNDGDDALNMKLSQSRADAVRTELIGMGIDAARLTAKGYGKTKPVADNNSFEGKANNRRVEFVKK